MPKYAKLKNGEVIDIINTLTSIPQDDWELKNILPIVNVNKTYNEGETPEQENGFYVLKDRVENVRNTFNKVYTLEELKQQKIIELDNYLKPKFPDWHRQTNTALNIYDEEKSLEIKTTIITWRDYFYLWKGNIEACETIEAVNDIDFRLEEDKDEFEKDKQIIS